MGVGGVVDWRVLDAAVYGRDVTTDVLDFIDMLMERIGTCKDRIVILKRDLLDLLFDRILDFQTDSNELNSIYTNALWDGVQRTKFLEYLKQFIDTLDTKMRENGYRVVDPWWQWGCIDTHLAEHVLSEPDDDLIVRAYVK
jgi:hypothetical protein